MGDRAAFIQNKIKELEETERPEFKQTWTIETPEGTLKICYVPPKETDPTPSSPVISYFDMIDDDDDDDQNWDWIIKKLDDSVWKYAFVHRSMRHTQNKPI